MTSAAMAAALEAAKATEVGQGLGVRDVTGVEVRIGDIVIDPRRRIYRVMPTTATFLLSYIVRCHELRLRRGVIVELHEPEVTQSTACLILTEDELRTTPMPDLIRRYANTVRASFTPERDGRWAFRQAVRPVQREEEPRHAEGR